ncbi:PTS fructose transporter subunit IIA [Pasteurellaceae bacterium Macca]|nr:PTS fructose transporter subunit IIA [Pasteurellaceae bacterium Macca]
MLNLSAKNICLNGNAENKLQAISLVAQGLVENGHVAQGYLEGMLAREQQTSTFLGNGIAIPHGTLDTRHLVQNTGVQVYQFPQGIQWGEDNIAYVVIGIAAKSDEHLTLLRQLTTVLSDEQAAQRLAQTQNLDEFIGILSGKQNLPVISEALILLNANSSSLLTLSALNGARLQEKGYVNQAFITDTFSHSALALGEDIFLSDSQQGNLANGMAITRSAEGKTLISVSAVDESLSPLLAKLTEKNARQQLRNGSVADLIAFFTPNNQGTRQAVGADSTSQAEQVIGTFTLRNEHGLHARPSAVLVQTLKPFGAKITVENLDRQTAPVNAKSTMRIVGLGATKGHRLRFVAEGEDAQQALNALAEAFASGLGESVSFVPEVEDRIDIQGANHANGTEQAVENLAHFAPAEEGQTEGLEAIFTIHNAHGLHARPSAVLVNEVKKYNATILVQNLDRETPLVSGKSLMKIVALGVQKGHRLRFVASGEEAQQALAGIGAAIESGLGE